jgi:hypothetical protein
MSQKRIKRRNKILSTEVLVKKEEKVNTVSIFEIIRQNFVFLTLSTFGTILIYLNSLFGAFVSDDYATILNNPKTFIFSINVVNFPSFVKYLIATFFGNQSPVPYHFVS